ncbi:hypothetical protein [Blastococcus sp. TF02A-35]|uniref:hypothetical protein n=1 Tax=Blastococcus sp. TF02A-35 TaxID=2559612 RepID=UPI0010747C0B|nr:hypothetical protein [Blastococcus sp. TF02A_35]TFV50395.1 hypothetical protein E4P43_10820 [Blastococcus sp. TF02A_35]
MTRTTVERPATPAARAALLVGLVPLAAVTWWLVASAPPVLRLFVDALQGLLGSGTGSGGVTTPVLALPLTSLGAATHNAVVAGIAAGLLARAAPRGRRRTAAGAVLVGVVLAVAAVVVTAWVAQGDAGTFAAAAEDRTAFHAAVALAALAGWLLGSCALLGPVGTGTALAAAAGVLPVRLLDVSLSLVDARRLQTGPELPWIGWLSGAVLVGALLVVGLRPVSRLGWWPLLLAVSWVVVPLVHVTWLLVMGLPPLPWSQFWASLGAEVGGVRSWLVPVAVAAVICVVRDRRPGAGSGGRRTP